MGCASAKKPSPDARSDLGAQVSVRLVSVDVNEAKAEFEIAGALVISEHTVARHDQNIFGKPRISSPAAATAFAFEHDLV